MLKSLKLISLCLLLFTVAAMAAEVNQYYFRFEIQDRKELSVLTKIISIDEATPPTGTTVYAYANDRQLAEFQKLGYTYTMLPNPGDVGPVDVAGSSRDAMAWDVYPTYTAYVQMMNDFATNYPDLCQIINIGTTVQGRSLLVAKISDNVATEESEPEVFYTSSMHGDETTGYVLMLRLIDSLLVGYNAGNTRIQTMVDNMEIYINPLHNPDGTYRSGNTTVSGAWRYNANSVDLNRNYPDPQDGPHPDGEAWQVETQAFMAFAEQHSFVVSANFHGGTEVVNYPWDTWAQRHADDASYQSISHQFADTAQVAAGSGYMTGYNDGITNGYDWYEVDGGRQDWMNYWRHCREVCIEISTTKLVSGSSLPTYWNYLRLSFLRFLEQAMFGIRGTVTDANTSLPLPALVTVLSHEADSSHVRTDPDHGNYHRPIANGTWNLSFSSPGYITQTVNNVLVLSNGPTVVDVQLQPVPTIPVISYLDDTAPAGIDPGEAVSMYISLFNEGGGAATNAVGVLSSTDPYVTITQNTSTYPTIAQNGGSAQSNAQYAFTVSPTCPTNHVAPFRIDVTADGGYVDSVFFSLTLGQAVEDFEDGNFTAYNWVLGGNQPWTITSSGMYEGTYAAASGTITHSQNSTMTVTLTVAQAGDVSFYYKVSSESNWDFLEFYIDGVKKASWSGTVGWAQASYTVTAGSRVFQWRYVKDGSQSVGSDKAWVDLIVFPPLQSAAPLIITTESLPDGEVGTVYSQQLTSTGGTGTVTWSDLNLNLDGTGLSLSAAGLVSGTPTTAGVINFTARAQDQAAVITDKNFAINVIQPVMCGDADGSESISISDAVYLIAYIFSGGPAPGSTTEGDPSCDGQVTISDAVYLISYIFAGGPAPCANCK